MTVDFGGDVVLVTGGGAGLGRAHARLLARHGARVVVNDLGTAPDDGAQPDAGSGHAGAAEQVVDEIAVEGGTAVADTHSVADPAGAAGAVTTALEHFGRIDAVVNNAGIVRRGGLHHLVDHDWQAVLSVHLVGSILVTRAAWPHFRAQGNGRVVMTASSIGLLGAPSSSPYAAAKLALVGLTRRLAAQGAASGTAVNAIAPMGVTRLNAPVMGQIFGSAVDQLSAERVAPVVAWLCHRRCGANGEVVSVAGGRVARFAVGSGPPVDGLDTAEVVAGAIEQLTATAPATWWRQPPG